MVAFGASAADGTFAASNIIGGVRQYVYDIDGTTKLAKANGAVEFFYNGSALGDGAYGFFADGIFSAGTLSIPGQSNSRVEITIDIWDKTTAATYEQASLFGRGYSQTLSIFLGGDGNPPASLVGFQGRGLILTPEPSTVALAALGLGGLLLVSRRN